MNSHLVAGTGLPYITLHGSTTLSPVLKTTNFDFGASIYGATKIVKHYTYIVHFWITLYSNKLTTLKVNVENDVALYSSRYFFRDPLTRHFLSSLLYAT